MPLVILLILWEIVVFYLKIPIFLLPAPSLIAKTLYQDHSLFISALGVTSIELVISLALTCLIAPIIAGLFHLNRFVEKGFRPIIIILQVTPLVAVIPLLLIWLESNTAVIVSAVLIAFIPLFLSIKAGLNEVNDELAAIFTLYKANKWQRFMLLNTPNGIKRFFETLPLTGSLTLVGTIVGEFVTGTGGGLAARLIESQYRLNTPRLFACLVIIAVLGLTLNWLMSQLSRRALQRPQP